MNGTGIKCRIFGRVHVLEPGFFVLTHKTSLYVTNCAFLEKKIPGALWNCCEMGFAQALLQSFGIMQGHSSNTGAEIRWKDSISVPQKPLVVFRASFIMEQACLSILLV